MASLIGDVVDDPEGKATLHIHIVLGTRDGTARAGHLGEGHVRPTLEVVLTESPAQSAQGQRCRDGLGPYPAGRIGLTPLSRLWVGIFEG